jgi:hypothetical protein
MDCPVPDNKDSLYFWCPRRQILPHPWTGSQAEFAVLVAADHKMLHRWLDLVVKGCTVWRWHWQKTSRYKIISTCLCPGYINRLGNFACTWKSLHCWQKTLFMLLLFTLLHVRSSEKAVTLEPAFGLTRFATLNFCDVDNIASVPQEQLYNFHCRNRLKIHFDVDVFFTCKRFMHCGHLIILQHSAATTTSQSNV